MPNPKPWSISCPLLSLAFAHTCSSVARFKSFSELSAASYFAKSMTVETSPATENESVGLIRTALRNPSPFHVYRMRRF